TNNASQLYKELLSKKEVEPRCDVVLNDNTCATIRYEMALSLFLVVDNHLSSRLAIHGATPWVIFTNADLALIAAICDKFPTIYSLYCMFYIVQNIPLNLKNHLKDNYDEFIKDFFEQLYTNKELWAKAFVLKLFMTGMSSTSWVESFNAKLKILIFNFNMTILELAEKLTACVLEEDKKTEYALFCASVLKAALVATTDSILPN
ncbi:5377_t:CDS:2, partial [Gigaspora rosea]